MRFVFYGVSCLHETGNIHLKFGVSLFNCTKSALKRWPENILCLYCGPALSCVIPAAGGEAVLINITRSLQPFFYDLRRNMALVDLTIDYVGRSAHNF